MCSLNTGISGNLSLTNGFTGSAVYTKVGNIVVIAFSVICPGDQRIFANVPDFIKPINEQYNSIWVQSNSTDISQLIDNVTIYPAGYLAVRNWNGGNITAQSSCRGSLVYTLK